MRCWLNFGCCSRPRSNSSSVWTHLGRGGSRHRFGGAFLFGRCVGVYGCEVGAVWFPGVFALALAVGS